MHSPLNVKQGHVFYQGTYCFTILMLLLARCSCSIKEYAGEKGKHQAPSSAKCSTYGLRHFKNLIKNSNLTWGTEVRVLLCR